MEFKKTQIHIIVDIIETYIKTILQPFLLSRSIPSSVNNLVSDEIKQQLLFVSSIWNDTKNRNTLFEVSYEEAINYMPKEVKLNIRMMVNFAIRNSILEDLGSDKPFSPSIKKNTYPRIIDDDIRTLMIDSIKFFSDNEFNPGRTSEQELYNFRQSHPITFNAFYELSKIKNGTFNYKPTKSRPLNHILDKHNLVSGDIPKEHSIVDSGYNPTFDQQLKHIIFDIRENGGGIFIPSFKMLTRNIIKLYDVFELILSSGGAIISFNYLIENGCVAKRENFIPVSHTNSETEAHYNNFKGLSKRHKQMLRKMLK